MNLFGIINYIRWTKPIIEAWLNKWYILFTGIGSTIAARGLDLIQTDWDLVAILIVLYLVDFGLGLYKSKKEKVPITSLSARQSVVKGIEYFIFLSGLVLISNGFEKYTLNEQSTVLEYLGFLVKDVDIIGFFGIIWMEFKSITENLKDKDGTLKGVLERINKNIEKILKRGK